MMKIVNGEEVEMRADEVQAFKAQQAKDSREAESRSRVVAAQKYLRETDWYVIRQSEDKSKPIPANIALKRQEARSIVSGD